MSQELSFEEKLLGGFPETQPVGDKIYSSGIYQPDRLLISSNSDTTSDVIGTFGLEPENSFYQFRVSLPRPAIEIDSIELIRASIPNPVTNIPDTETTFWYWRIPIGLTWNASLFLNPAYLYFVRLLPSYYDRNLLQSQVYPATRFAINRTFNDYTDLASELAKACLRDPLEGVGGVNFITNDISLTFNSTLNKFQLTGNNPSFFYASAGANQIALATAQQALQNISVAFDYVNPTVYGFPGQQFHPFRTMNLRLGFSWNGSNVNFNFTPTVTASTRLLLDRFRPLPLYQPVGAVVSGTTVPYTAEFYACLVYTNCVNVYLDVIGNGTLDSEQNQNLLASVPMATANLGITFFSPVISSPITHLQTRDLYSLAVTLLDDVGNPFPISNCGIVSLELAIKYLS